MNKILKTSLILLPVAVGGYIIYRYVNKNMTGKKQREDLTNMLNNLLSQNPNASSQQIAAVHNQINSTQANSISSTGCNYPLKKGSKNKCVEQLQWGLINGFGSGVLPKYGADGDWGSETESAMLSYAGKNKIIDSNDLNNTIMKLLADGKGLTIFEPVQSAIPYDWPTYLNGL